MTRAILGKARLLRAKRAFSTRRVPASAMCSLIRNVRPQTGDLVLARVDEIGKQAKLELTDGRKAHMFPGDEIVVCYGDRYAPDQYESKIGNDLSPCDLVAAGGVASVELCRRIGLPPPTQITPVGLIGDAEGHRLNLMQYGVEASDQKPAIPAVLSLGTSMNAGKTLTATSMVRGFRRLGFKVAALKITGTGSGGDMWIVHDAGADVTLDFTDAGYATTYLVGVPEIETAAYRLMNYAASQGCEIAVIEIADGLQQLETAQLIRSPKILDVTVGTVFAAYDAMGAKYGVDVLREADHDVLGISGRLGRSPLAAREAEAATGLRVYSPWDLQEGALVPVLRARAIKSGATVTQPFLGKLARMSVPSAIALSNVVPIGAATETELAAGLAGFTLARDILERAAYHVMKLEVDTLCGSTSGSQGAGRRDWRNGFSALEWLTDFGQIDLRIPKLKHNEYLPSFIQQAAVPVAAISDVIEAENDELEIVVGNLLAAMMAGAPVQSGDMDELVDDISVLLAAARRQGLPLMQTVETDNWPAPNAVGASISPNEPPAPEEPEPESELENFGALFGKDNNVATIG